MHAVIVQQHRFQITSADCDNTQNDPKCGFNFGSGPARILLRPPTPEFIRVPFNFFIAAMRGRHDLTADGQALAQRAQNTNFLRL